MPSPSTRALDERALDELGPALSALFPAGSNVELVTTRSERVLDLLVWERGVGRTLACGTGACAAVSLRRARVACRSTARLKCACRAARYTSRSLGRLWT
ncbi:MAG: hypothetical protein WDO74_33980 [Pseudomonadota bacterium]